MKNESDGDEPKVHTIKREGEHTGNTESPAKITEIIWYLKGMLLTPISTLLYLSLGFQGGRAKWTVREYRI